MHIHCNILLHSVLEINIILHIKSIQSFNHTYSKNDQIRRKEKHPVCSYSWYQIEQALCKGNISSRSFRYPIIHLLQIESEVLADPITIFMHPFGYKLQILIMQIIENKYEIAAVYNVPCMKYNFNLTPYILIQKLFSTKLT